MGRWPPKLRGRPMSSVQDEKGIEAAGKRILDPLRAFSRDLMQQDETMLRNADAARRKRFNINVGIGKAMNNVTGGCLIKQNCP